MEFTSYKSIENTYRKKYLDKIIARGRANGNFIVQEKVHGTNFSLWYDGVELKQGKRSGFIREGGGFYDTSQIITKYEEKVIQLYHLLKNEKDVSRIVVFGELFGGIYPHRNVPENKDVPIVQQGIYYTPDLELYTYDILADDKYLSARQCHKFFAQLGFFYAEPLFSGGFADCLQHSNLFPSTIPARLGLPEIEGNICEGVIIRSDEPDFFSSSQRVILKNKNEKWEEKAKVERVTQQADFSEEANALSTELLSFVTANRLRNVISKLGKVGEEDLGIVIKGLIDDVWNDFGKDFQERFDKLKKLEERKLTKQMKSLCATLVKENWENIVQGRF